MGSGCILNDCLFNTRSGSIVLGDNVKISHNVMILTGKHDFFNPGFPVVSHGMDIKIGSNVWIGAGSIILGRVCIGDNVIVGAGSIVTKDVPSNCMVCCDPARVIKEVSV